MSATSLYVNAAQLEKAAALIGAAEPSIVNGVREEAPGFLSQDDDTQVVVLTIGVLPRSVHRINRRGKIESEES